MHSDSNRSFEFKSHVLVRSQAPQPGKLLDVLTATAVKESWIMLLIHIHTTFFFSLILMASGHDVFAALLVLVVGLAASCVSAIIIAFLIRLTIDRLIQIRSRVIGWLTFCDCLIAGGIGISMMIVFQRSSDDQFDTLVVLLLAAGIASAALSAKLVSVLITGRVLMFLPPILYLTILQPPNWLLHSTSLALSFAVTIGVGYAIHIQLLREASLVVEVNDSRTQVLQEARFREQFLRSITHDLRQPITSIGLFIRGLHRNVPELAKRIEINSIEYCLQSADQILENVAQLAWVNDKLPKPPLVDISVDSLLAPLIDIYRLRADSSDITLRYRPSGLSCVANASYLERAVRNLLENALEHSGGGRILVATRKRYSRGEIEIQVFDTGCGINQSDWQRIFDAYERIQDSSSNGVNHLGLGLSIVNNIADALGGRVRLNSRPGFGSCFSLILPCADPRSNNLSQLDTVADLRFLIVDDDPRYAGFVHEILSAFNATISVVSNEPEIDLLFTDHIPDADVYIVDQRLGNDHDGVTLLKKIGEDKGRLLLSHNISDQTRAEADLYGIYCARKPKDEFTIIELIQQALRFTSRRTVA